ncbi:MAG TPA: pilus assembly protein [Lacipirellulaceae bacterium]|nr:pilus assembly protein [Lacipirellulaceae bacterium]
MSVSRRGIATIEFVLSLPILFILFAMILTLGMRHLDQAHVQQIVRRAAWEKRSQVERSRTDSKPFALPVAGNALTGLAQAEAKRDLRVFPWLKGNRLSQTEGWVLAGSWDYAQVPEMNGGTPHLGALGRVVAGACTGAADLSGLPGLVGGLKVGSGMPGLSMLQQLVSGFAGNLFNVF